MNAEEAAELTAALRPKLAVPVMRSIPHGRS
jgi:hypothetical protein